MDERCFLGLRLGFSRNKFLSATFFGFLSRRDGKEDGLIVGGGGRINFVFAIKFLCDRSISAMSNWMIEM